MYYEVATSPEFLKQEPLCLQETQVGSSKPVTFSSNLSIVLFHVSLLNNTVTLYNDSIPANE